MTRPFSRPITIASCGYTPQWHASWAHLAAKIDAWVAEAAGQGAELLVFPEYAGIETALIDVPGGPMLPSDWSVRMAARADDWRQLHVHLAKAYNVHIIAGSLAVTTPRGMVNRSYLVTPEGACHWQDKMITTPYERREMAIVPGDKLHIFDTALGALGILICYDSEFPLQARALVEAGVEAIIVPCCTELAAGQTRVRQSCRARAIEGQCLIVQAPLMGAVADCEIVEISTGRAAMFCPPDLGLPSDGIITEGQSDVPGWTIARIDPAAIAAPRTTGQVGNYAHWPEQDHRIAEVARVSLTAQAAE